MSVIRFMPKMVTRNASRAMLKTKKNSPHILFGAGVVGVIGGTVLACRSTLKLESHLTEMKNDINHTKNDHPDDGRAMAKTYIHHSIKIGRLYAPAAIVGGAGLAMLTGSHVQLTRRNTALTAAYAGLAKAYDEYRSRVRQEIGEEKELEIFHAVSEEAIEGVKGKSKVVDVNKLSLYSRIFDESNINWQRDAELNRVFVQCQQNYFNHILQVRGHVFLNEVYEHLGFEHSSPGAVVGWVLGDKGDNHIDFGIFEAHSSRFVNGDERSIVLDFNVDGVIYDLI